MPDLTGFGNFGNGLLSAGDFAPSRAAPVTPTRNPAGVITGPTQALPVQPAPARPQFTSFGNINYGLLAQPQQSLLYAPLNVPQQQAKQVDLAKLQAEVEAKRAAYYAQYVGANAGKTPIWNDPSQMSKPNPLPPPPLTAFNEGPQETGVGDYVAPAQVAFPTQAELTQQHNALMANAQQSIQQMKAQQDAARAAGQQYLQQQQAAQAQAQAKYEAQVKAQIEAEKRALLQQQLAAQQPDAAYRAQTDAQIQGRQAAALQAQQQQAAARAAMGRPVRRGF